MFTEMDRILSKKVPFFNWWLCA